MENNELKSVRKYLIGTKFYIKEHRNNFSKNSIISIDCKVNGTNRNNNLIMLSSSDFSTSSLKNKINEALSSNDEDDKTWHQEYYELDETLSELWKKESIEELTD